VETRTDDKVLLCEILKLKLLKFSTYFHISTQKLNLLQVWTVVDSFALLCCWMNWRS